MDQEFAHPLIELKENFNGVTEFRKPQGKRFLLNELLALSIIAMLCGAEGFTGRAEFCKEKEAFLRRFFKLSTKTPSHDQFRWVFANMNPKEFFQCFMQWTQAISKLSQGEVVPIDGKALWATRNNTSIKSALHLVSAWASDNGLALGQVKVDKKSYDFAEEKVKAHGRIEHRKCYTITALEYIPDTAHWPKLKSLVCLECQRVTPQKTTFETRYYLSSLRFKWRCYPNAQYH